ncbi:hypothetical protein MRX96_007272 [Rhipicephalus microplus]
MPENKDDALDALGDKSNREDMSVTSATLKLVCYEINESGKTSIVNSEEPPAQTSQGRRWRSKPKPSFHSN